MGLAICKSIVEQYGGSIEVCSDGLEKGTTFTFSMKMKKATAVDLDVSVDEIEADVDGDRPPAEEEKVSSVGAPRFGGRPLDESCSSAFKDLKDSTDLEMQLINAISDVPEAHLDFNPSRRGEDIGKIGSR